MGVGTSTVVARVYDVNDNELRSLNDIAGIFPVEFGLDARLLTYLDARVGVRSTFYYYDYFDATSNTAENDNIISLKFGLRFHFGNGTQPMIWSKPYPKASTEQSGLRKLEQRIAKLEENKNDSIGQEVAKVKDDLQSLKLSMGTTDASWSEDTTVKQETDNTAGAKQTSGDINLPIIFFAINSFEVPLSGIEKCGEVARIMKNNSAINITIIGFTDEKGSDDYNRQLGKRRAEAVYQKLVFVFGIDKKRINIESQGKTSPLSIGKSEVAKSYNRRVEFKISE